MCSTIHQNVAAYQIFAHPEHDYIIQIHILSQGSQVKLLDIFLKK